MWFELVASDGSPYEGFVEHARALAPAALSAHLAPDRTRAHPARWGAGVDPGIVLAVDVPGFPRRSVHLQVMLLDGLLTGCWADEPYFVDFEPAETLGTDVDVAVSAARATEWMASQLGRPVHREEWLRWRFVIADRTVLSDTGTEVLATGKRSVRQSTEPHRVIPLPIPRLPPR